MNETLSNDVLKAVQRKFPVCNVLDARVFDRIDISKKCSDTPRVVEIRLGKTKFNVLICTGSFNVYVLKIEEKE